MGFVTYEMELISIVSPTKLFRAIVLEAGDFLPKIFPQLIASFITIEGDGGPGTIKQINYVDGKNVKERTDAIDKENFMYAYSVIEGEALMNKFEKLCYEYKFEGRPDGDGGSICRSNIKYYTIGNTEMKQEEIDARKEKSLEMFRAIEAYLLANSES